MQSRSEEYSEKLPAGAFRHQKKFDPPWWRARPHTCRPGSFASIAVAPRPTSSTSSTCQELWCRKATGACWTSTLWWSVEQRMNAASPGTVSLTLNPTPCWKNFWENSWSVEPSTTWPSHETWQSPTLIREKTDEVGDAPAWTADPDLRLPGADRGDIEIAHRR